MFKLFSTLIVAGAATLAGVGSAQACGGCSGGGMAAPTAATATAPRAPTATAQNGRQSIRRYSVAPGATTYRAPSMMYGRRSARGPSWSATRKVLGY